MGTFLCKEDSQAHQRSRGPSASSECSTSLKLSNLISPSVSASKPQQNYFVFDQLCFDSRFEAGNLLHAEKSANNCYNLWIAPDCFKTHHESKHGVWFYFSVSNVDLGGGDSAKFIFRIKNMDRHVYKTYSDGMLPVYSSASTGHKWQYIPTPVKGVKVNRSSVEISFEYTFDSTDARDATSFAFSFPYTYTYAQNLLKDLEKTYANDPDIYFRRELLTHSLEGRNVDLITITAQDPYVFSTQASPNTEPSMEGLFPLLANCKSPSEHTEEDEADQHKQHRPFIFRRKKYILISCRAHPGETPASFMLEGLIKSLLNRNDMTSRILLQNFVFVIVPMLNPDGVYRGHYRYDSKGNDLDRAFQDGNRNKKTYPSVSALMDITKSLSDGRLVMYLDLHTHGARNGGFITGNPQEDLIAAAEMRVFAAVYDIYSKNFDLNGCTFTSVQESPMLKEVKKEGDLKWEVARVTGITHSYKLECGYFNGTKDPERYSQKNETKDLTRQCIERLDVDKYEEIGMGLRHALLEVFAEHPLSKIGQTWCGSVRTMRSAIYDNLTEKRSDGNSSGSVRSRTGTMFEAGSRRKSSGIKMHSWKEK